MIRVLIADDEPLAREGLRFYLSKESSIDIVAECRNGREAVAALRKGNVDVVFLDIKMPGKDGFSVVSEIGASQMPVTVFVTAHDQYAIQAFQAHALDYLTKPLEPARLADALARAQEHIAARKALRDKAAWGESLEGVLAELKAQNKHPQQLLVPHGSREIVVNVSEIEWIDAADYYACLHVGGRSLMLRKSIKELAVTLDPRCFVRVHRSVIVNTKYVREVCREGRNNGSVIMAGGRELHTSEAGWQAFVAIYRG